MEFIILEDLLEKALPASVFIAVQVPIPAPGTKVTDIVTPAHADRVAAITKRVKDALEKVTIKQGAIYQTPPVEGHAQILPTYTFVDAKCSFSHLECDLAFVYDLDKMSVIIKSPDELNILPYTRLG